MKLASGVGRISGIDNFLTSLVRVACMNESLGWFYRSGATMVDIAATARDKMALAPAFLFACFANANKCTCEQTRKEGIPSWDQAFSNKFQNGPCTRNMRPIPVRGIPSPVDSIRGCSLTSPRQPKSNISP
jgi:hypothetical protein